jgi:hypothetical protein
MLVYLSKRWKENVCLNFLKSFLDLAKNFCVEENQLYIAKRETNSKFVSLSKLTPDAPDYNEKYFLREWFKDAVWDKQIFFAKMLHVIKKN